ncbi:putative DinB family protein [Treponema primitia ZAS-2]|uniref:Putative DinB family protein n=1 Tax=Treponema primitia (strain ATCC BAA-887 / DSM 12427 / ZAS-2) TaxID=545694 RepID=F5YH54_TREPZ|nr:DinB family protein [Treponema primitia]AEF86353.1 putative DinB family protein [Treponema primitia ZAS-2]
MDKKYFELLGNYNKGANEKMNTIIKTLSEEEWDKAFAGYYKSIHELCSHLFIGDYNWLTRFRSAKNFKSLKDEYFTKNYSPKEAVFKTIDEYINMRMELDKIIIDLINEIAIEDIKLLLKWTNAKKTTFEKSIGTCLIHLSNHETHHRAMISLYLDMLGKENDYSNLYPYG